MTKIKNLKDNSTPSKITSEELSEMQGLSRAYNQVRAKVADLSFMHYQALRNMEALEARMGKFNEDITKKYKLKDDAKIDQVTGEIK